MHGTMLNQPNHTPGPFCSFLTVSLPQSQGHVPDMPWAALRSARTWHVLSPPLKALGLALSLAGSSFPARSAVNVTLSCSRRDSPSVCRHHTSSQTSVPLRFSYLFYLVSSVSPLESVNWSRTRVPFVSDTWTARGITQCPGNESSSSNTPNANLHEEAPNLETKTHFGKY